MIYGSVCSGIEAATVAWGPLGWRPAFFSEIEAFPRAVLRHHYPTVPVHGDFTTIGAGQYDAIDLLVGGTPCQDFSVAGQRSGLDGERGGLSLEFPRLARRLGARWIVWENVPGVLSMDAGRAFGTIIGEMVRCGYDVAWRVLDARYFGVAQRRKRVFVVGYTGDWRRAVAVLFERPRMCGDTEASEEAGERVASPIAAGSASGSGYRNDADTVENLIAGAVGSKWAKGSGGPAGDECHNLVDANGAIRRLTPLECERLQGFPDNHTAVPYRGKPAKDAPRYRAIGNSMAVPVMRWIGQRIAIVDRIVATTEDAA